MLQRRSLVRLVNLLGKPIVLVIVTKRINLGALVLRYSLKKDLPKLVKLGSVSLHGCVTSHY